MEALDPRNVLESDAKKRWCPFGNAILGGRAAAAPGIQSIGAPQLAFMQGTQHNRVNSADGIQLATPCVGSGCMMWVALSRQTTDNVTTIVAPGKGRCGLVSS